jgi:plasmid stabilization system protein ParE
MAEKAIVWTSRASEELNNILEFSINRNKSTSYAEQLLDLIDKNLLLVQKFPEIGRITEDQRSRILVIKEFLLIYEISGSKIIILSFWDGKQNPEQRYGA